MSKRVTDYKLPDQRQKGTVTAIAWSPDGRLLASCASRGDIQIWDAETHQLKYSLANARALSPCLTWSPDSTLLAVHTSDEEKAIKLWNIETRQEQEPITALTRWITCLAWSPDGNTLAGGCIDGTIRLWCPQTRQHMRTFSGHVSTVSCLLWSPEGSKLVTGSSDKTICVWDTHTWSLQHTLTGHFHEVSCLTWLASEPLPLIASGSYDRTIRIWDLKNGLEKRRLECHTTPITSLSASNSGDLLASKAEVVRIWSTKTWEPIEKKELPPSSQPQVSLAFSPRAPRLALVDDEDAAIWILDMRDEPYSTYLTSSREKVVHYTNAKVVLVGDMGVGKSALSLVLVGKPFVPTESSHGREVWALESLPQERDLKDGTCVKADTLVWDLAGQSSYRLIHQLHLKEVAVALVLFDYHSDTDPFAGVDYWNKALNLARKAQGTSTAPINKLLVAARVDRGGRRVNLQRINDFWQERGFNGYYETSAKNNFHIQELIAGIERTIDWDALPRLTSPQLFQSIKDFLFAEKKRGRVLASIEELYQTFLAQQKEHYALENLNAQFETCICLVESSGLIHRLCIDNYILLQPELIDAYASALVNSVSNDPDGSGSILEQDVCDCHFTLPEEIRVADHDQERRLLFAMIEDLIRNEVVLRDQGYLIFPSQSTKEHPEMPDLQEKMKTVTFTFEGPIANIYAVLTVRLSRSGTFIQPRWWKNAVVYTTVLGGTYGISLDNYGEGRAKMTLFFDANISKDICSLFEHFIEKCLEQKTLMLVSERIFLCEHCGEVVDSARVQKRRDKGFNWILCGLCGSDKKIWLYNDPIISRRRVDEMNQIADEQCTREIYKTLLAEKKAIKQFDVFISYNVADAAKVKKIAEQLEEKGILPWLEEWEVRPGVPWQRALEDQIRTLTSAAVFIGKHGMGPWHRLEMDAFLNQCTRRACPVIPVILPDAPQDFGLPLFLEGMRWVDFRKSDPNPLEQLIWGITGERSW